MSVNLFENEDLALASFVSSGGKAIRGPKTIVQTPADPTNTPSYSSSKPMIFPINKNGDLFIDNAKLVIVLSALSGGSGGTYNHFVNAVAIFYMNFLDYIMTIKK